MQGSKEAAAAPCSAGFPEAEEDQESLHENSDSDLETGGAPGWHGSGLTWVLPSGWCKLGTQWVGDRKYCTVGSAPLPDTPRAPRYSKHNTHLAPEGCRNFSMTIFTQNQVKVEERYSVRRACMGPTVVGSQASLVSPKHRQE